MYMNMLREAEILSAVYGTWDTYLSLQMSECSTMVKVTVIKPRASVASVMRRRPGQKQDVVPADFGRRSHRLQLPHA